MSDLDDLLTRVGDEAEANESRSTPRRSEQRTATRGGSGALVKTLQVRMDEEDYRLLEHEAKIKELPVSTAARGILVRAVKHPVDDLQSALRDLAAATERVQRLTRQD